MIHVKADCYDPTPLAMDILLLSGPGLAAANAVYASIAFAPSDPHHDWTFGVFEAGLPIALGRIQRREGELELGGFWVDQAWRGRGLARRMVEHVLDQLPPGAHAWCIPFDPLVEFYCGFGMVSVPREQAPPGIQAKLGFCAERTATGIYAAGTSLLRYDRPT